MKLIKALAPVLLSLLVSSPLWADESICYGEANNGRLENGSRLPSDGKNFESYSMIAESLGRTYVHDLVHEIVVQSYGQMFEDYPEDFFKYGETGFKNGGEIRPHRSHQNGLSVDFYVPVRKGEKLTVLPTNLLNKWGYNTEFDEKGKYRSLVIDFEVMARHITA